MNDYDIIKEIYDKKKKEMSYYYKLGERMVIDEIAKKHGIRNNISILLHHLRGSNDGKIGEGCYG